MLAKGPIVTRILALLVGAATLVAVPTSVVWANSPPEFTSPPNAIITENSVSVLTLAAADPDLDTVSFTVTGGADMALFSASGPQGAALEFITPPDFEDPGDLFAPPANNVYQVQVTADDGNLSSSQLVTIFIQDVNESPEAVDQAFAVAEGAPIGALVGTVSATDPDAGDRITGFAIVAGDQTGAFAISAVGTLTIADAAEMRSRAPFSLVVRAFDTAGLAGTASITVTVVPNRPPAVDKPAARASGVEGEEMALDPVKFSDADTDDVHTAIVDWGDGIIESATVDAASKEVTASHVYADNATYGVTVTIRDALGAEAVASRTLAVANAAPTVADAPPITIAEGGIATFGTFTFNDAGTLDTHPVAFARWRDGSPDEAVTVLESPFGPPGSTTGMTGFLLVPSHRYQADGTYFARVCVKDDEGRQGCRPVTVNVENAPPVITSPPQSGPVDEGDAMLLDPAPIMDPGGDRVRRARVDWGDATPVESARFDPDRTEIIVPPHTYASSGTYEVTICAEDKQEAVGCDSAEVTVDNVRPTFLSLAITDTSGNATLVFDQGDTAVFSGAFSDPGDDRHTILIDWGDGSTTERRPPRGERTFEARHRYDSAPEVGNRFDASITLTDDDGGTSVVAGPVFVNRTEPTGTPDTVGLFDPASGRWHLRSQDGDVTAFLFGAPGDAPLVGDWDCDGRATPGLYRPSVQRLLLSNSIAPARADVEYVIGEPGDLPLSGDFNGDGCDTVSLYRPSNQRIFLYDRLGSGGDPIGTPDADYGFGNPGDKPFVADFDGNGIDEVGLHRETTGLVYYRLTQTSGIADDQFIFGNPGDRLVGGDWTGFGFDTPALFRPSTTTFFFRFTNSAGRADDEFVFGERTFLPVAGTFGLGGDGLQTVRAQTPRRLPTSPLWPLETPPSQRLPDRGR